MKNLQVLLLFVALSAANVITAQQESSGDFLFGGASFGASFTSDSESLLQGVVSLSATFRQQHLLSAQYTEADALPLIGNSGKSPSEHIRSIGALYGRQHDYSIFRFYYQAGPEVVWAELRDQLIETREGGWFAPPEYDVYDMKNVVTGGLAARAGVRVMPLRYLAIGFDYSAHVNLERSMHGFLLSAEVGIVRPRLSFR